MGEEKQEQFEMSEEEAQIDPMMVEMAMQRYRDEQNIVAGIVAGAAAAVLGASIWAVITVIIQYQIGWMAVGVGFLVGIAIRTVGKGIDTVFGVMGAVLSLVGCLLGNLFTVCYFVSVAEKIDFFDLFSQLNPMLAFNLIKATFSPMDVLFYGIAVYEGYKLSFRKIPQAELMQSIKGSAATIEPT